MEPAGIRGEMAGLYDLFVDWDGRLGREMPGITKRLEGARRVLDAGCGTGRHLKALLDAGFDAVGADVSEDMLAKARDWTGRPERLFCWRIGDEPGKDLRDAGPFDAIVCLGNTWSLITAEEDVAHGARTMRDLLRPGGLLLVGLKALEVRRGGNAYMPLLRREHEGEPVYFIRFVDFDRPEADLCDFHMVVVKGADDVVLHRAGVARVWCPETLERAFREAGFTDVRVSARLDDPDVPPTTEDVFVHAC